MASTPMKVFTRYAQMPYITKKFRYLTSVSFYMTFLLLILVEAVKVKYAKLYWK